ncbi:transglutaminase-like domain-containing protein [Noviherbaspirillum agri]
MKKYLESTPLLDFDTSAIRDHIHARDWHHLPTPDDKIRAAYDFVRNDILFGYNASDDIPASAVLADGYGQCNTKTTLLMALLRALGIACRFHGATIDKALQRGAVTGLWFSLAPAEILHSWAEVWFNGKWVKLEGVILDDDYLGAVQRGISKSQPVNSGLVGYAIATQNIANPDVGWKGCDTAIQQEGIARDLGIYDSPDAFYAKHGVNMSPLKRLLFSRFIRHRLNARVEKIRRGEANFDLATTCAANRASVQ